MSGKLVIRFDGPPSPPGGRFVEVELDGASIDYGVWEQHGKDWLLVLPNPEAAMSVLRAQLGKHREHPHAPILGGGGTVKCACYGCNLARRALAAFGGKK